jgi:hypothetical protein
MNQNRLIDVDRCWCNLIEHAEIQSMIQAVDPSHILIVVPPQKATEMP